MIIQKNILIISDFHFIYEAFLALSEQNKKFYRVYLLDIGGQLYNEFTHRHVRGVLIHKDFNDLSNIERKNISRLYLSLPNVHFSIILPERVQTVTTKIELMRNVNLFTLDASLDTFSSNMMSPTPPPSTGQELFNRLTPRQLEVIYTVLSGGKNSETALDLGIHYKTVSSHKINALDTLKIKHIYDVIYLIEVINVLNNPEPRDSDEKLNFLKSLKLQ